MVVAGAFYCIWAYHERGFSGLQTSLKSWLIALITVILVNLFLRGFRENTDHHREIDKKRWLSGGWVGWMFLAVGAVVGAYAFGLVKGIALAAFTVVAVLLVLLYGRFAMRHAKPDGPATK